VFEWELELRPWLHSKLLDATSGEDGKVARAVLDYVIDGLEKAALKKGYGPGETYSVTEKDFDRLLKRWWGRKDDVWKALRRKGDGAGGRGTWVPKQIGKRTISIEILE